MKNQQSERILETKNIETHRESSFAQVTDQLQQALGERKDVRIISDIRLKDDESSYTFDHLVLHHYGIIIIDSTSLNGFTSEEIKNKKDILSVSGHLKKQSIFLRNYMKKHEKDILRKLMGMQVKAENIPFDFIMTFKGDIKKQKIPRFSRNCQFSSIDGCGKKVADIIKRHCRQDSVMGIPLNFHVLTHQDKDKIGLLLSQHQDPASHERYV